MTNEESLNVINSLIRQFIRLEQPTTVEGLNTAKDALEKQIPMRVTRYIRNRTNDVYGAGNCPKCGVIVTELGSYCSHCGQRLDWEQN